jgi:hypothetical protein
MALKTWVFQQLALEAELRNILLQSAVRVDHDID